MSADTESEVRAFPRRPAKGKVVCRVGKLGIGAPLRGDLVNISQTGALVALPKPVKAKEMLTVQMESAAWKRQTEMLTEIRWCVYCETSEKWLVGLKFERPMAYDVISTFGSNSKAAVRPDSAKRPI